MVGQKIYRSFFAHILKDKKLVLNTHRPVFVGFLSIINKTLRLYKMFYADDTRLSVANVTNQSQFGLKLFAAFFPSNII